MRRVTVLVVLLACGGGGASPAAAGEIAVGVTSGTAPELVRFDTAAPGALLARVPVTGLAAGESVSGLDLRPATGELWAVTSSGRMLLVDAETGVTRQLGVLLGGTLLSPGQLTGSDFNPAVDRLRLVTATDDNLRFNPLTYLPVDSDGDAGNGTQGDTDLAYIATDENAGQNPSVVASAYTNNDNDGATPTTLFGIDSSADVLVRQGAVDGNAADVAGGASPNGGLLTTIGSVGIDVIDASFDIARGAASGSGNIGYAALQPATGTVSVLARVDLGSGATTSRGAIGDKPLAGMTIALGGAFRVTGAATVTSEAAGQVVVTVERAGDTLAPARVGFRTADRTAVAGADYVATSGSLDFAAGERTKQVTVGLLQNTASEQVEALALEFGSAGGGAVIDTPVHVIEIADDDPLPVGGAVPGPADLTRPVFLAAPTAPSSLTALRRAGGLGVDVACSEPCVVRLTLRLSDRTIGSAGAAFERAGVRRLRVRLSAAGRRVVDRARRTAGSASLVLRGTATDASGNRATRTSTTRVARRGS